MNTQKTLSMKDAPMDCDCGGSGWTPGIPDDVPCPIHAEPGYAAQQTDFPINVNPTEAEQNEVVRRLLDPQYRRDSDPGYAPRSAVEDATETYGEHGAWHRKEGERIGALRELRETCLPVCSGLSKIVIEARIAELEGEKG